MQKTERIRLAILKILAETAAPMGATRLQDSLLAAGVEVQARTVRFHLLQLDREGLTESISRRAGRTITRRGREESNRDKARAVRALTGHLPGSGWTCRAWLRPSPHGGYRRVGPPGRLWTNYTAEIRNPDRIYPGQVFMTPDAVPPGEAVDPKLREPLAQPADGGAGQ